MAVPAGMEATYDKWQKWHDALVEGDGSIASRLDKAAKLLRDNIGLQNSGKWTDEPGPKAFSTKYADYLTQESDALLAMAKNARKFAKAVQDAMEKLQAGDADAVGYLDGEAKKIPAVYVSDKKKAAFAEFLAHPCEATFEAYSKYIY